MKRPSTLDRTERTAYYRQYIEPLLSDAPQEQEATAPVTTSTNGRRGSTFPGTMVIAALLLGCALGWGTSWLYYRHVKDTDEAMLQMHKFLVEQEAAQEAAATESD